MKALLATVAGVTLLVSGCGAATPQRMPTADVPPPTGVPVAPAGWRPSTADQVLLEQAEDVLAGQCMRALGYKYWTTPEGQDPNRQYVAGLSATKQARYNEALFGPMGGGISAKTPDGEELVLSDRGCLARARTELYGDLHVWFTADTLVSNLQPLIDAKVAADPRSRRSQASRPALEDEYRTAVEKQYAVPVRTLRGLQYRALATAHKLTGRPAGDN